MADRAVSRPRKPSPAERREERSRVEDVAPVLEAAARTLEARPRTVMEVRRRLLRQGYRADLVERVVERLVELRYLDDEAFARAWIESRDRAAPRGEHALRRELALKGVDRATVDALLEEREADAPVHNAGADELAAQRLLAKKLPALRREPDPRKRLQKAYALLARNGFPPDVCSSVARRALATDAGPAVGEAADEAQT